MFPRGLSYAIGDASTWLSWRLMNRTRAAVMDNLSALFPHETGPQLAGRALRTFRSYARDVVDFLCALRAPGHEAAMLVDVPPERAQVFHDLLARGRGIILVGGHYGNWEFGGILMRRVLDLPLTVIAMAEAAGEANRIRREIRDGLGIDTLEVRQSLDTALQIRRRLSENRVVAFLMDRHIERDRVAVTLLDRPAWFLRTPVLMAYLTEAPLLPCFIERAGRGLLYRNRGDADRGVEGPASGHGHPAGRAAIRRSAGRTRAASSGLLVSLLSILGRPTYVVSGFSRTSWNAASGF